MKVLVAGGTGLVGNAMVEYLVSKGHDVCVLTRNPRKVRDIKWDPSEQFLSVDERLREIEVIVNLSGQGINDRRWTERRKKELEDSRIGTNQFLFDKRSEFPALKQFISASGITAYPFDDGVHLWNEKEGFGDSYIAQLVKRWEESADLFQSVVPVCKLRIAVVLAKDGGALPQLATLTKRFLGSAVGSGKQQMPWVAIDDLVALFEFAMIRELKGVYNTNAGNISNEDLMQVIKKELKVNFSLPKVPSTVISLVFGERGNLLLEGNRASNLKILNTGFQFQYHSIELALRKYLK